MNLWLRNFLLLALMLAASGLAVALRPTHKIADQGPKVDLEIMVPRSFGDWQELKQSSGQIINPQQTELLSKLYSQTLSRTYVNPEGATIMLSIAYGANQSDGVALHYPEVCYPSQGFQLLAIENALLTTDYGTIRVKRLMTALSNRSEPVTYWSILGNQVVQGGLDTKLTQLKYGFNGQIPDGLIFRISSITPDAKAGYETQARFTRDLMVALPASSRLKLAGLGG